MIPKFITVVLLCAASMPHDTCNRHNAEAVFTSPASSEIGCGVMEWQQMAVANAYFHLDSDEGYIKTICERRSE